MDFLPKNSIGAEIGTHKGVFAEKILKTLNPKTLYLIDPWVYQKNKLYVNSWYGGEIGGSQLNMDKRYKEVCQKFEKETLKGQVVIYRDYSHEGLKKLPDNHLDWVYIDGCHLFDFVIKDLRLSFEKVKVGGYITGDDYTDGGWWAGVLRKQLTSFLTPLE